MQEMALSRAGVVCCSGLSEQRVPPQTVGVKSKNPLPLWGERGRTSLRKRPSLCSFPLRKRAYHCAWRSIYCCWLLLKKNETDRSSTHRAPTNTYLRPESNGVARQRPSWATVVARCSENEHLLFANSVICDVISVDHPLHFSPFFGRRWFLFVETRSAASNTKESRLSIDTPLQRAILSRLSVPISRPQPTLEPSPFFVSEQLR